jgi:hypothetical protein
MKLLLLAACLVALSVPACAGGAPQTPTASGTVRLSAASIVMGVVRAPKGILASVVPTGGGNLGVISNNGGAVVPTGGGNLMPAPGAGLRSLLAVTEAPLAGATVFVGDVAGRPYPLVPAVTTDAEGRFTLPDVPSGFTVTIVVKGHDEARAKDVTLQTIVKTSELGATANVDTSSSLVTLAVLDGTSDLGEFNPATFRTATEAAAKHLTDADVPDLSDRSAVIAKVDALAASVAELKTALEQIRQDLKAIKATVDEINQKLGAPPAQGGALPPPGQPLPPGPNGGAGICTPPTLHELVLTGKYDTFPLVLEFISMRGDKIASATFEGPGKTASTVISEICSHRLVLAQPGGAKYADHPSFAIPKGAPKRVELPI